MTLLRFAIVQIIRLIWFIGWLRSLFRWRTK